MDEMTRRSMLQVLGAAGLAALLNAPAEVLAGGVAGAPLDLDVAVVGAGVGGAYTAWRLLTANPDSSPVMRRLRALHPHRPLRVGLFETSGRVGGRLYSVYPPGMPHLPAEIGGMRVPSTHTFVHALLRQMSLATIPFPTTGPRNLAYLRSHRLLNADFVHPNLVPYDLPPGARGKAPADVLVDMINSVVPGANQLSQQRWDALKPRLTFHGQRLQDVGMWEVLERTVGNEGAAFLRDAFAYTGFFEQFNAADLMAYLSDDFAPIPEYVRLARGYQALPLDVAARFQRAGGNLVLYHRLRRLDRTTLDGQAAIQLGMERTTDGRPVQVRAHHVVLGMTRHAIKSLDPSSFPFRSHQFRRDLDAVSPIFATRLFLGFRGAWWKPLGITGGRSVTDLPLRMCFYWGVEGEQAGADPSNANALFFASYAEDGNSPYWGEFLDHPPAPGTHQPYTTSGVPLVQPQLQAPARLVEEAMRQVRELHGPTVRIPDPYTALFVDWKMDPFGASWHLWNVHEQSGSVIPRMRRPIPDANLHIVGDTWSTDPGWVRGALNTSERVLERQFGLPRPFWLPSDVYLGP